jgi:hypothetical protein
MLGLNEKQKTLLYCLKVVGREVCKEWDSVGALTSLTGELSACELLNMSWKPSTGYDCIDNLGKKVQVKSRRDSKCGIVNKQGRLGKFGKKGEYKFDRGLYVELDGDFNVVSIYEVPKTFIQKLENNEKGGRALHVSTFIKNAGQPIYKR